MRVQPAVLRRLAEEALKIEALDISLAAFNYAGWTVTVEFTNGGSDPSVREDRTMWITGITRDVDRQAEQS